MVHVMDDNVSPKSTKLDSIAVKILESLNAKLATVFDSSLDPPRRQSDPSYVLLFHTFAHNTFNGMS